MFCRGGHLISARNTFFLKWRLNFACTLESPRGAPNIFLPGPRLKRFLFHGPKEKDQAPGFCKSSLGASPACSQVSEWLLHGIQWTPKTLMGSSLKEQSPGFFLFKSKSVYCSLWTEARMDPFLWLCSQRRDTSNEVHLQPKPPAL